MNSYTLKTTLMTALFVFSSHCIAVSYNETAKGFIEEIVYDSQKYSQTAGAA